MDAQIESIARAEERIKAKARAAFERGEPASSCVMWPWTSAYKTWQTEYARLEAEAAWAKAMDRETA